MGAALSPAEWSPRARPVELFLGPYTFGEHTFAVRGTSVPVLDVHLGGGMPVLFEQACVLWRDPAVRLLPGPGQRPRGRGQVLLAQAHGPGRVAFSPGQAARVFMLYLPPGRVIELRDWCCLCSAGLWYEAGRPRSDLWLDRFQAGATPGLLILFGTGDVFELALEAGESLDVQSQVLLYKEQGVDLRPIGRTGEDVPQGSPDLSPLRCTGPGIVAIQARGWGRR